MFLLHFVIQICIFGYVSASLSQGTRMVLTKRSVKSRAFNRACKMHSCSNTECTHHADGWGIYGSDLGCCGNYNGCCKTASVVCYLHDVMCKCCDYGWIICGPECRREPECDNKVENNDIYTATQNFKPDMRENNQSQNALHNTITNDQSQKGLHEYVDNKSNNTTRMNVSNLKLATESNALSLNETVDCVQSSTCFNDSSLERSNNSIQNLNGSSNYTRREQTISANNITELENATSSSSDGNQTMAVDIKTDSELQEDGFIKYPSKYYKKKQKLNSKNIANKLFKTLISRSQFFDHPFDFTRKDDRGEGSGDVE